MVDHPVHKQKSQNLKKEKKNMEYTVFKVWLNVKKTTSQFYHQ